MATSENKKLARHVLGAFGGKPVVTEYYSDDRQFALDILECSDCPHPGTTSYSTLGLSDHPMRQDGKEFPVRVELVAACDSNVEWFPNVISTAAFYIMRSGWLCSPGKVLQNALHMYDPSHALRHLYFTAPSLWQGQLETVQLETKKVAWLLAVPIAEPEYEFLQKYGDERFEDLLEGCEVDIFNIKRSSLL
jgi:hypothetical protein